MSHTREICKVHRSHRPWVSDPEIHHIEPLGMGGEDVRTNVVTVCPTGHTNLHNLLRIALRHGGSVKKVPWKIRRKYSFAERMITEEALRRIHARRGKVS